MNRAGLLLASLAVSACSSMPDIEARQMEDAALIQNVLTQDATLRLASSECMRLHPELMPLAYEAQTVWWQRNGQSVVEADQSLNKLVLDSVERAYNPIETTLGLSVSLQASLEAQENRDDLVDEDTDLESCRTLMTEYKQGERDLTVDEELAERLPRLAQLAAEYYPPTSSDDEMLQSPDRSQFIAERLAQQALCEQAQLTPLVRQWPREVYNVSCGLNRQALIRCEWSECRVLP
ncbi:MAG: hypothetical protein R3204_00365 [Oceanospirillum sp.]|nr:hypothetical protein [Oceanospirillum sp.]